MGDETITALERSFARGIDSRSFQEIEEELSKKRLWARVVEDLQSIDPKQIAYLIKNIPSQQKIMLMPATPPLPGDQLPDFYLSFIKK